MIGFADAGMRCHAEYRTMPASGALALKPDNLSFEEAASLMFGGTTALHFLRKSRLVAGERLLVIGASGAVGSAMVQLGRNMGVHVTGVTSSGNLELVTALGAHELIDYTRQDFAGKPDRRDAATYDVIADTVGASSFAACQPVLKENGRYLPIAGTLRGLLVRPAGTKVSIGGTAWARPEDVVHLANLAGMGMLKPVIDTIYPFARLPDAHARVETGRKRGSVIVSVNSTLKPTGNRPSKHHRQHEEPADDDRQQSEGCHRQVLLDEEADVLTVIVERHGQDREERQA